MADPDEKTAMVIVPDYQLSLAIGKEGQNARLAARLTGFKIDIKSETQARESGDFEFYEEEFEEEGYECMHLDNTHSEKEREDILAWFEKKDNAILSSVSILTTGFDSPSVQTIILNRATKSLTLYHQMIGRGSRILPNKKAFNVIDLGNNARRFGLWEAHINWTEIFKSPNSFIEGLYTDEEIEDEFVFEYSDEMMEKLQGGPDPDFNMAETYIEVTREGGRPKEAIERSIKHHVEIIQYVSEDFWDAMTLAKELEGDIAYRIRLYSKCIAKTTENYKNWLKEEYSRKLQSALRSAFVTSEEEG